jgi:hypothetical protein
MLAVDRVAQPRLGDLRGRKIGREQDQERARRERAGIATVVKAALQLFRRRQEGPVP